MESLAEMPKSKVDVQIEEKNEKNEKVGDVVIQKNRELFQFRITKVKTDIIYQDQNFTHKKIAF